MNSSEVDEINPPVLSADVNLSLKDILTLEKTLSLKALLCSQDLSESSIKSLLKQAFIFKNHRHGLRFSEILKNKTFTMLFHSPSLRTRLSFETAMNELGGSAIYLTPDMGRFKNEFLYNQSISGESIEDIAAVMSGYSSAIGIRIMEKELEAYKQGYNYIKKFSEYATIPVINMADDRFHPCQGLSELMTLLESFTSIDGKMSYENLKGKTYLLTWGKGCMARSWNSVQESLLIASRFGMNVRVARPKGYDLDQEVYSLVRGNCHRHDSLFEITDDFNACYDNVHVVCSRNWLSESAYKNKQLQLDAEVQKAMNHDEWITTREKMSRTDDAFFSHPMPIDRNREVTDEVVNSKSSLVYQIAKNRLYLQKSVLCQLIS